LLGRCPMASNGQAMQPLSGLQPFLKRSFDDLSQTRRELTAEQPPQHRDIPCRMKYLGINRHLKPKPNSIQLHATAIGCPFGAPNHRAEPTTDLTDSELKAPTGLFYT